MRRIPFSFTTVVSTTAQNSKNFNPLMGYVDAGDVKKSRIVWETIGAPSGISITQGVQAANSDQSPDNPTEPAGQTATTTNVVTTTALLDVSATTASKQLVRPGLYVANTGSAAQLSCRVVGFWETDDK